MSRNRRTTSETATPKRSLLRSTPARFMLGSAAAVAVVVAAVIALNFWGSAQTDKLVPAAVPVAISNYDVTDGTKVGVLVTLGTGTNEGSEWLQAAEGATVARERLARGGTDVTLLVEHDDGTADSAEAAIQKLIDSGVSGIVIASAGAHLDAALNHAQNADVPVVLPYESVSPEATHQWSLAYQADAIDAAIDDALADYDRPLIIAAEPAAAEGLTPNIPLTGSDDLAVVAGEVARLTGADQTANGAYAGGEVAEAAPALDPSDAIVIIGPAITQATLVRELQARNVTVPIVLTPQAISPVFAATLVELDGSVSSNLTTVGGAWDDAEALRGDGPGRGMSAFLAAVRQVASTDNATSLLGDVPFAKVAAAAEVRSHDAVIALVAAVSGAGNTSPAEVARQLETLELAATDGIAGPALDFRQPHVSSTAPSMLYATSQQLGLRPQAGSTRDTVVWFTAPKSS